MLEDRQLQIDMNCALRAVLFCGAANGIQENAAANCIAVLQCSTESQVDLY